MGLWSLAGGFVRNVARSLARMVIGMRQRIGRLCLATLVSTLSALAITAPAQAESAYCADLKAQIARAGKGNAQRYRAVAARQRAEYARLSARARALRCDEQQFLIFGDDPPAQCGPLNQRLRSLYDSIGSYDRAAAGGDDGQREALMARYQTECRNAVAGRGPQPRNFFEELFGVAPPDETTGLREVPVGPNDDEIRESEDQDGAEDEKPLGGRMAVCVRACDGGFFPVSYSARRSSLEDLETMCKALCPNAEVALYTRSLWGGMEGAVSIAGDAYKDHPNAFKYQTSYDSSCGCKPPGKSWAEALEEAERILAERNKKDQVVTAEEAEKLSRPYTQNDPRLKKQKGAPKSGADDAAPLLKPSVVEGMPEGDKGAYREVVGPDGVKRRVRVVAPDM